MSEQHPAHLRILVLSLIDDSLGERKRAGSQGRRLLSWGEGVPVASIDEPVDLPRVSRTKVQERSHPKKDDVLGLHPRVQGCKAGARSLAAQVEETLLPTNRTITWVAGMASGLQTPCWWSSRPLVPPCIILLLPPTPSIFLRAEWPMCTVASAHVYGPSQQFLVTYKTGPSAASSHPPTTSPVQTSMLPLDC